MTIEKYSYEKGSTLDFLDSQIVRWSALNSYQDILIDEQKLHSDLAELEHSFKAEKEKLDKLTGGKLTSPEKKKHQITYFLNEGLDLNSLMYNVFRKIGVELPFDVMEHYVFYNFGTEMMIEIKTHYPQYTQTVDSIIEYKRLGRKLRAFMGLEKYVKDGKIMPFFSMKSSSSGSISSHAPNLSSCKVEPYLKCREGKKMYKVAFKNEILYILSNLIKMEELKYCSEQEDGFTSLASMLYGIKPEDVEKELRTTVKRFIFKFFLEKTMTSMNTELPTDLELTKEGTKFIALLNEIDSSEKVRTTPKGRILKPHNLGLWATATTQDTTKEVLIKTYNNSKILEPKFIIFDDLYMETDATTDFEAIKQELENRYREATNTNWNVPAIDIIEMV